MIAWTVHPAKRRPQDVALAAMIIALTAFATLVSLESLLLTALAVVLLLVAIAPFLLPTHYRLDDDAVSERRWFVTRTRAWSQLQRLEVGQRGAFVSPFKDRRWLDRYRGITIMFPDDREPIVAVLRARVDR